MVPLVATRREFDLMKAVVDAAAKAVFAEKGREIAYLVGTMIELPRAALMAGEIAKSAEFFSFGTNDLTQTTIGISRDDAGRFLTQYVDKGIFVTDPFVSLRSEEHTSELQSLMRISYAVFCLKKKKKKNRRDSSQKKKTQN